MFSRKPSRDELVFQIQLGEFLSHASRVMQTVDVERLNRLLAMAEMMLAGHHQQGEDSPFAQFAKGAGKLISQYGPTERSTADAG